MLNYLLARFHGSSSIRQYVSVNYTFVSTSAAPLGVIKSLMSLARTSCAGIRTYYDCVRNRIAFDALRFTIKRDSPIAVDTNTSRL